MSKVLRLGGRICSVTLLLALIGKVNLVIAGSEDERVGLMTKECTDKIAKRVSNGSLFTLTDEVEDPVETQIAMTYWCNLEDDLKVTPESSPEQKPFQLRKPKHAESIMWGDGVAASAGFWLRAFRQLDWEVPSKLVEELVNDFEEFGRFWIFSYLAKVEELIPFKKEENFLPHISSMKHNGKSVVGLIYQRCIRRARLRRYVSFILDPKTQRTGGNFSVMEEQLSRAYKLCMVNMAEADQNVFEDNKVCADLVGRFGISEDRFNESLAGAFGVDKWPVFLSSLYDSFQIPLIYTATNEDTWGSDNYHVVLHLRAAFRFDPRKPQFKNFVDKTEAFFKNFDSDLAAFNKAKNNWDVFRKYDPERDKEALSALFISTLPFLTRQPLVENSSEVFAHILQCREDVETAFSMLKLEYEHKLSDFMDRHIKRMNDGSVRIALLTVLENLCLERKFNPVLGNINKVAYHPRVIQQVTKLENNSAYWGYPALLDDHLFMPPVTNYPNAMSNAYINLSKIASFKDQTIRIFGRDTSPLRQLPPRPTFPWKAIRTVMDCFVDEDNMGPLARMGVLEHWLHSKENWKLITIHPLWYEKCLNSDKILYDWEEFAKGLDVHLKEVKKFYHDLSLPAFELFQLTEPRLIGAYDHGSAEHWKKSPLFDGDLELESLGWWFLLCYEKVEKNKDLGERFVADCYDRRFSVEIIESDIERRKQAENNYKAVENCHDRYLKELETHLDLSAESDRSFFYRIRAKKELLLETVYLSLGGWYADEIGFDTESKDWINTFQQRWDRCRLFFGYEIHPEVLALLQEFSVFSSNGDLPAKTYPYLRLDLREACLGKRVALMNPDETGDLASVLNFTLLEKLLNQNLWEETKKKLDDIRPPLISEKFERHQQCQGYWNDNQQSIANWFPDEQNRAKMEFHEICIEDGINTLKKRVEQIKSKQQPLLADLLFDTLPNYPESDELHSLFTVAAASSKGRESLNSYIVKVLVETELPFKDVIKFIATELNNLDVSQEEEFFTLLFNPQQTDWLVGVSRAVQQKLSTVQVEIEFLEDVLSSVATAASVHPIPNLLHIPDLPEDLAKTVTSLYHKSFGTSAKNEQELKQLSPAALQDYASKLVDASGAVNNFIGDGGKAVLGASVILASLYEAFESDVAWNKDLNARTPPTEWAKMNLGLPKVPLAKDFPRQQECFSANSFQQKYSLQNLADDIRKMQTCSTVYFDYIREYQQALATVLGTILDNGVNALFADLRPDELGTTLTNLLRDTGIAISVTHHSVERLTVDKTLLSYLKMDRFLNETEIASAEAAWQLMTVFVKRGSDPYLLAVLDDKVKGKTFTQVANWLLRADNIQLPRDEHLSRIQLPQQGEKSSKDYIVDILKFLKQENLDLLRLNIERQTMFERWQIPTALHGLNMTYLDTGGYFLISNTEDLCREYEFLSKWPLEEILRNKTALQKYRLAEAVSSIDTEMIDITNPLAILYNKLVAIKTLYSDISSQRVDIHEPAALTLRSIFEDMKVNSLFIKTTFTSASPYKEPSPRRLGDNDFLPARLSYTGPSLEQLRQVRQSTDCAVDYHEKSGYLILRLMPQQISEHLGYELLPAEDIPTDIWTDQYFAEHNEFRQKYFRIIRRREESDPPETELTYKTELSELLRTEEEKVKAVLTHNTIFRGDQRWTYLETVQSLSISDREYLHHIRTFEEILATQIGIEKFTELTAKIKMVDPEQFRDEYKGPNSITSKISLHLTSYILMLAMLILTL